MRRMVVLSLAISWTVWAAGAVLAKPMGEGSKAYAEGMALLAKDDFEGALASFEAAVKADTENQEYVQQYAMLRQIVRMRQAIADQQDEARWLKMAEALRTFYWDHRLYSEVLPLDQERHRRAPGAESATLLAETQLALEMDAQAVAMLEGLTEEQTSPRTRVLHGLALARLGHPEKAKQNVAADEPVADDVGPRYFYDLARLQAVVAGAEAAVGPLARSLELTPPSRIDAFRSEAKSCKEFARLMNAPGFAEILETPSKVEESSCSKGPSCGSCPKRATCGEGG
ncbi:MAG: hypothetical protein KJ749_09520 [Planctomycetes bacterium]|nr:hypothetical protein [Planctomycetota bacterium]